MESINILDDILSNSKGYEYAFFTTFNFEIPFFEKSILSRLENNNIKKIGIFVDSKNYIKALNMISNSSIGKKYIVSDVNTNTSFHPKLILLLGEKKARLIVTSANLTFSGYYLNNEIFNIIDFDNNHQEHLSVIKDAYVYFKRLNSTYNKLDSELFELTSSFIYLHRKSCESDVKFISNYNESIMSQIDNMNLTIKQIDISVPFYDSDLNALKNIKKKYPLAEINLYIQNEYSTFNYELNNDELIIPLERINIFDSFHKIGTKKIYHGKVFRFITDTESYILYGSANCTEAALYKSSTKDGNCECDILEKGKKEDYDYFFSNFRLVNNLIEFTHRSIEYNDYVKYNFKFVPTIEMNIVCFTYRDKWNDLRIYINNKQIEYEYMDNKLVIDISNSSLSGLFRVDFVSESGNESLNAFVFNKKVLDEYRNSQNNNLSVSLDKVLNSSADDYYSYYRMFLSLIPYDVEALINENEAIATYKEAVIQAEPEDDIADDFDYDFIVDFDVPDSLINKNNEYNKIEEIKRGVIRSFISLIKTGTPNKPRGTQSGIESPEISLTDEVTGEYQEKQKRFLSEKKRFINFVKRQLKGILNPQYLKNTNIKKYVDNIFIILNIIYEYNEKRPNDSLNLEEYNKLILNFFDLIKNSNFSELDEDIIYSLKVIIISNIIQFQLDDNNKNAKEELFVRKLLLSYDQLFCLKNNNKEYILRALDLLNNPVSIEEGETIIKRIFNYMNEDELIDFINDRIDDETLIEKNDDILYITINSNNISKYFTKQQLLGILNESKNRYRQTKEVNKLIINIYNSNIDVSSPNPMERIRYVYNITLSRIERYFKRKNDDNYQKNGEDRI